MRTATSPFRYLGLLGLLLQAIGFLPAPLPAIMKADLNEELDAVTNVVVELQRTFEAQRAELANFRRILGPGTCSDPGPARQRKRSPRRSGSECPSAVGRPPPYRPSTFNQLESTVAALKNRLACLSSTSNSGDVYWVGRNLHLRNGIGSTDQVDGKGDVLVGYNVGAYKPLRTGSHNVGVGDESTAGPAIRACWWGTPTKRRLHLRAPSSARPTRPTSTGRWWSGAGPASIWRGRDHRLRDFRRSSATSDHYGVGITYQRFAA
jgi:hypothetical protein